MRIFVIHNFYQHAGGEDQVFEQEVRELSKENDVQVYTCSNVKGLRGFMQYLSYPTNLLEAKHILKEVQAFSPDVVHIHNLHYGIGPWVVRRLRRAGIPVLMTLHNFRLLCPSASLFASGKIFTESLQEDFPWTAIKKGVLDHSILKTFLTGFTYWVHRKLGTWKGVNRYVVLSDFAKRLFQSSSFPVQQDRFVVRPNSIDLHPIDVQKNDRLLYIGRLAEEKGIVPLVEALVGMHVPLDIYGAGPQLEHVLQLIENHPQIRYMGYQSGEVLTSAIAAADALVVPSVCYEGMPMTIIEAFAQGTPVIASAIGILKEMVVPLYTGMHVDPFQKEDIQHKIRQWRTLDPVQKTLIGQNCKREYEAHYTMEKNMQRLVSIYQEAIAENKKI
ncbi:glycosyltransferase family 4 protein [Sphingobacterium griseoflavum]|uniref:Glycosyl transferase n=1 Tax=Sphingobacterium griseoflavum TaxID=1474952 RepID=A0ABQ3I2K3_9SPHI|nr:glycosyltransferase family 4 protein [Sphingobacterium griseoflavum]GHE43437.1 glycosyl transferase [Sphingobacterium griseoflavum]